MPEVSSSEASAFCLDPSHTGIEDSGAGRFESLAVLNSPTN